MALLNYAAKSLAFEIMYVRETSLSMGSYGMAAQIDRGLMSAIRLYQVLRVATSDFPIYWCMGTVLSLLGCRKAMHRDFLVLPVLYKPSRTVVRTQ
jgi:hypothetical protein